MARRTSKTIRILQVIQELRTGGAERVVLSLLDGSRGGGHQVALATAPGASWQPDDCGRFDLPILSRHPHRVIEAGWRLRSAIKAFRPDLIHCHNPGMAAVAALVTARGSRPPALVSLHGVPEHDYPGAVRVLRLAGLPVIACGPGVAAALEEHGLQPQATVANGIPAAAAPPTAARRRALLEEWGIPARGRVVVAVGRLVAQKNHRLVIDALPELPHTHLVIVGEGPLEHELSSRARHLGVVDRLVLAGPRPDARTIMAAADAVVITSDWEGLPLVALEAMASATPLVATAARGLREMLRDGVDSLLVPPGDANALAVALRRVLEEAGLGQQLARQALAVAAGHTEEEMVRQYLELYLQLVSA